MKLIVLVRSNMDNKDYLILQQLYRNPRVSLTELKNMLQVHSVATVFNRIKEMERVGLIVPPPSPKMARSRTVSIDGKQVLVRNGLIQAGE